VFGDGKDRRASVFNKVRDVDFIRMLAVQYQIQPRSSPNLYDQGDSSMTISKLSVCRHVAWRCLICLSCLSVFVDRSFGEQPSPNVVLILADDLGWTDLACYGSDLHETPNLDRLAQEGLRFVQNYSACTVCSPTRAALMTGKYPARLHITDWIPGRMPENPKLLVPDWTKYLPLEEVTLADIFKSAGHRTASIGKWHLGDGEFVPTRQGFDTNIAGTNSGSPPTYFSPWRIPTLKNGDKGDYLTDRLGEEAASFIAENREHPFFLYLPHFAVHTPTQGRADLVAKYESKIQPRHQHRNAAYAAMVESLDGAVGRVLQALDEHSLTERTLVIFTSDNGGRVPTTSNIGLRVGKGSAYEGGLRVPLIMRWPEQIAAGRQCNVPTITMDIFPTIMELTNLKPDTTKSLSKIETLDGLSLGPLIRGETSLGRDELFWHYPHHQHYQLGGSMPFAAIRSGDFKLIEFYNDNAVELYNLANDLAEQKDLAFSDPARAKAMQDRLHAWQIQVGAQMPLPNPDYDPSKPEHTPTK
jgi:arylsulfatase A